MLTLINLDQTIYELHVNFPQFNILLNTAAARQTKPAGKTMKTQFLVIGTTAAAIGAGLQAANSGIKTLHEFLIYLAIINTKKITTSQHFNDNHCESEK